MNRYTSCTRFLLIAVLALSAGASPASEPIREEPPGLVMGAARTDSDLLGRLAREVYGEAFARMGMSFSYRSCIPNKCGQYVVVGILDGELGRTAFYEQKYPELVRTSEPVIHLSCAAFARKDIPVLTGWEDLRGSHYRIAYIGGYFRVGQELQNLVKKSDIVTVRHWTEGIEMLEKDEVDIYIGIEETVRHALKAAATGIHSIGTLERFPLYAYFNKKHRALAERLSGVIKEMKTDGTLQKVLSKATAE